jgi:hypothetical protein
MLTHQNSDPVKSLKQTHSKDDFSTNDNAVESVLRGLWNVHDGLSVANRATEPPVVSRPLGKNSNFVSFAQEPQISPKLTRLPEIRTPEVLEKPLADFVVKLHDYQQSWEGSGERQCPGPRDHPGLGDQDSMSQRPPASRPASRSPPNGQRIILPPVQHVRSSQVAPPGEDWRSLGVHSILNPIHLRDDGQQDSRLPLPVGSPESSPKPSEFELDMRGKKIATTQSEDPCESKPAVSFMPYYIFEV